MRAVKITYRYAHLFPRCRRRWRRKLDMERMTENTNGEELWIAKGDGAIIISSIPGIGPEEAEQIDDLVATVRSEQSRIISQGD